MKFTYTVSYYQQVGPVENDEHYVVTETYYGTFDEVTRYCAAVGGWIVRMF